MTTQTKVTDDQQTAGQSAQPTMQIEPENTALVVTDPQIDFLSPAGVVWGLVGKSIEATTLWSTSKPCSGLRNRTVSRSSSRLTTTIRPITAGNSKLVYVPLFFQEYKRIINKMASRGEQSLRSS